MLLVVMMSLTLFSSCQKEDEIIPGIIYTNDPPEEIFGNSIYATTNKCWIEKNDFTISAKNLGWNTNQFWDQERQYYVSYDSGEWYLVPARKYWGIMNGIIYLSESKDWYVMSPQNYLDGWNNVQKKNTIVGYSCTGCQNPFGKSSITGFE
jgi:hypothetical protein